MNFVKALGRVPPETNLLHSWRLWVSNGNRTSFTCRFAQCHVFGRILVVHRLAVQGLHSHPGHDVAE
jgi:hypothetical protein